MKGTSTAMRAELGRSLARLALCWKVTKNTQVGSEVLTWTDHDVAIVDPVDGLTYEPIPGGSPSDIASDLSLQAGNVDVTAAAVEPNPTLESIRAGDWDYAAVDLFWLCWSDPSKGRHFLRTGTVGNLSAGLLDTKAEFRGLMQALSQSIVDKAQAACRHRFGSGGYLLGGCNNDGTTDPDDFKVEGTLDAINADGTVLQSSAFVELSPPPAGGAGSFGWGKIRIDDGPNAGRIRDIKASSDGEITLQLPFPRVLTAGVAFTAFYGCDGLFATCRHTYDNTHNFDGEKDLPGLDKVSQVARK